MNKIILPLADRLANVGEYYFSKKLAEIEQLRKSGKDIISLGIGSPDGVPASEVVEALYESAQESNVHGYANYKGTSELLEAVAKWYNDRYGVSLNPASEILSLYGSKEGLIFLCNTFINKGDKVLIPNPGYPAYKAAVNMADGECVEYVLSQQNGWFPNLEKIDTTGVKMMIVNYPHMPTGAQPTKEMFEKLVSFAKENNILLVHDNPYSFIRNPKPMSLLSVEGAKECCVELNSLSKSHNMAGWRIGFMVGNAEVLASVMRYKSNLNNAMFVPLQRAATVALGLRNDWYENLNDLYKKREVIGKQIFDILGVTYQEQQSGLFLWGKLPETAGDCYQFCDKILYEKDVFLTPGGIFGSSGDKYVRLSLCANEKTLLNVIERLKK